MDFLVFLIICYCNFGVSIIPKWLINDSWWIPILFGWFLELPAISPHLVPYTSFLCRSASRDIRKSLEASFKNIVFHISPFGKSNNCRLLDTTGHQKWGFVIFLENLKINKVECLRSPKYDNISNVLLN